MKNGIFITATGTDVGKTYVTALLVKAFREAMINAGYYKAALSGALFRNGELIPGDAEYVCRISGLPDPPGQLVSYVFQTEVSPHLASIIEKKPVERQVIYQDFLNMQKKFEYLIVEGCGGIICPINVDQEEIMLTDLIRMMQLDIIIVAPSGLGTINATVLTAEHAKSLRIGIRGIILNRFDRNNFLHLDNKKQIERLTGVPVIACVPENADEIELDILTLYKARFPASNP